MPHTGKTSRSFTLTELVAVITIVGILSAGAGLGMGRLSESFVLAAESAGAAQKARIALERMRKELTFIEHDVSGPIVSVSGTTSISYTSLRDSSSHTISWSGAEGAPIVMDNDTLIGDIKTFSVAYNSISTEITVWFVLSLASGRTLQLLIHP